MVKDIPGDEDSIPVKDQRAQEQVQHVSKEKFIYDKNGNHVEGKNIFLIFCSIFMKYILNG